MVGPSKGPDLNRQRCEKDPLTRPRPSGTLSPRERGASGASRVRGLGPVLRSLTPHEEKGIPRTVKLLLPPRQSRGNSLQIRNEAP